MGFGAPHPPGWQEILDATGRDVSTPAVYVTMKRMEKKGLVASEVVVRPPGLARLLARAMSHRDDRAFVPPLGGPGVPVDAHRLDARLASRV
jgi:hypothetical protein